MRTVLVSLLVAAAAHADTPAPDVTITWDEGEISRDMSMWHSTVTLTGTRMHYEATYRGRDSGRPSTKPRKADAVLADPKALAVLLATFDKAPVKVRHDESYSGNTLTVCIARGKTTRCVTQHTGDAQSDEVDAATAIQTLVVGGFKLGDL